MATAGDRASLQWRTLYEAAVLELDRPRLLQRIAEAQLAIMDHLEHFEPKSDGDTENGELMNALTVLGVLHKLAATEGQSQE